MFIQSRQPYVALFGSMRKSAFAKPHAIKPAPLIDSELIDKERSHNFDRFASAGRFFAKFAREVMNRKSNAVECGTDGASGKI
jgi:hypothetical protein